MALKIRRLLRGGLGPTGRLPGHEGHLGVDHHGPILREPNDDVRPLDPAALVPKRCLLFVFVPCPEARGLENPVENELPPIPLKLFVASKGLGELPGLGVHALGGLLKGAKFRQQGGLVLGVGELDLLDLLPKAR